MAFPVILRDEIRRATEHLSFGLANPRRADFDGWASQAERLGYTADWAIDWIIRGYPEVPEWIKVIPAGIASGRNKR